MPLPRLILGRDVGQEVFLDLPGGEVVTVRYVKFDRGRIRLAFEAPLSVGIRRGELAKKPDGAVPPADETTQKGAA